MVSSALASAEGPTQLVDPPVPGTAQALHVVLGRGDEEAAVVPIGRGDGVEVDLLAGRAHPGGGPFNTARTIGRLEQPVAFLGRLSSDRFGTTHERMLAEDAVRLDAVVWTDEPTTLALAEVDASGSARYRFYERGTRPDA